MQINWPQTRVRVLSAVRVRWRHGVAIDPWWDPRKKASNAMCTAQHLWFFWAGRGKVKLRSGWRELGPGSCLWLTPDWVYEFHQDPKNPLGTNAVQFDLLDAAGSVRPWREKQPPEFLIPPNAALVEHVTARVVDLLVGVGLNQSWSIGEGPVRRIAEAMLTALLMDLDGAADSAPTAAESGLLQHQFYLIQNIIEERTASIESFPSIAEIAKRHGYSREHFARVFRKVMGVSPSEFFIQKRVERAKSLLRGSPLTISQIAEALGYQSVHFFSRQFKRRTGTSPARFRKAV